MKKLYRIIFVAILVIALSSCEGWLSTNPSSSVSDQDVFKMVSGGQAALNGAYYQLFYGSGGSGREDDWGYATHLMTFTTTGDDVIVWGGWYTFDYDFWGHTRGDIFKASCLWVYYYRLINNVNSIIAYIDDAEGDAAKKDHIKGQALALRGWAYFHLVRLFQHTYSVAKDMPGVPLYTEPSTDKTEGKPRGTVQQVYDQVLEDFLAAETLLEGFTRAAKNNIDQDVVRCFLAQTYLTMENWAEAEKYAHLVNLKYPLTTNAEYDSGFNTPTPSWIWCQYQDEEDNLYDYSPFCMWANWLPPRQGTSSGGGWTFQCFFLATTFVELFEEGDVRKQDFKWVWEQIHTSDKFYDTDDLRGEIVYLRSEEMLLTEAEAIARQGGTRGPEATALLNQLQTLRGATATEGTVENILIERRKELYGEGLDWFDLKRNRKGLTRGGNHETYNGNNSNVPKQGDSWRFVFQIPNNEIVNNPNMDPGIWPAGDQNPFDGVCTF